MGNVFGMKELGELYIMDISFPEKYQKQFKGPKYGIDGIRRYIGTLKNKRPHTGTIVKPKVGLTPKEFAKVAYDAWSGGLDLVKDDENLVDQKFCSWKKRFNKTVKLMHKAEKITGEKKLYATNITDSSIPRMLDRLDYVKEHGHKMVMLDVYVLGMAALSYMLDQTRKYNLFVHAHRAGYAAHHRGSFGVNFQVYEKLYRMLGVDQLHIGTGIGKMEGSPILIKRFNDIATKYKGNEKFYLGSLKFTFAKHIKPMFPVTSGGVDPGLVDALVALHGNDIIIQAGGGVHGHPKGTKAGAQALRAAVNAAMKGITVKKAALHDNNLGIAIKKFGYYDPRKVKLALNFEKHKKVYLTNLIAKTGMCKYRKIIS
jgi:ribulose-bisphosphate carboxylase large chain